MVPYDLYLTSERRIGYYGTKIEEKVIKLSDINQSSGYLFDLRNCRVDLIEHD